MGQSVGSLRSHRVVRSNGELIMEQHIPPDLLEFQPDQSQMIAYGIDKQTNPKFSRKTLSPIAGKDATSLSEMFNKTVCLPSSHISCNVASVAYSKCTYEGMHKSFMEAASKVGTNGIFVFSFTGHGIKIGQSNKWGLAPVDFDYTSNTFITADTIVEWFQFVRFQGRYALFILDCCYAGGIAEQMVKRTVEVEIPVPGLFILTACTALESSLVVTTLEHSIFNFFLGTCLYNSYYTQKGRLAIKEVYEECERCCLALSSLLISYDMKLKLLKWKMMQPEIKYFHLPEFVASLLEESDDQTDAPSPGRFQFVLDYYIFPKKGTKRYINIPDKCQGWLEIVAQPNSALAELHQRHFIEGKMLTSIVGSMMYSMASFFVACEQPNITARNTFLVAFLHVVATVDRVHQNINLTITDLLISLEYYFSVLDNHKISAGDLKKLYNVIRRDIFKRGRSENGESTDSAALPSAEEAISDGSDEDIDIPILTEWVPAEWNQQEPEQL